MRRCPHCRRHASPTWEYAHALGVTTARADAERLADQVRENTRETRGIGWQTRVSVRGIRAAGQSADVYAVSTRRRIPHACDPAALAAEASRIADANHFAKVSA